tara:strand:- start:1881 stop:2060 length:180 start_codon:yes stop_codon:yes gene_type:complete
MANQRMAGDNIFLQSQQMQQEMMRNHEKVRNVMERQRRRDVAAAQGQMIPFTQADILKM